MDPPRSASSRTTRFPAQGSNTSRLSSASTSNHTHEASELPAAGTSCLDSNSNRTRKTTAQKIAPDDVLGQFSLAPATQTTVVTTTTTTTTSFPPLIIKEPRNAQDLDPIFYPLASLRTPDSLTGLQFMVGDQTVVFREADDAASSLNEVSRTRLLTLQSRADVVFFVSSGTSSRQHCADLMAYYAR